MTSRVAAFTQSRRNNQRKYKLGNFCEEIHCNAVSVINENTFHLSLLTHYIVQRTSGPPPGPCLEEDKIHLAHKNCFNYFASRLICTTELVISLVVM